MGIAKKRTENLDIPSPSIGHSVFNCYPNALEKVGDPEDSLDRLVFSILDDAVSTNGWTKRRGDCTLLRRQITNDRIVVAKKILTQRMLEQFKNQETKSRFKDEFDALKKHNLVDPMDIPSEAEGIAEMFSNVTIQPVLEKAESKAPIFTPFVEATVQHNPWQNFVVH